MEERIPPEILVGLAIFELGKMGIPPTFSEIVKKYGMPEHTVCKGLRWLSDWGIITSSYGETAPGKVGRIHNITDLYKDEFKKYHEKIGDVRKYFEANRAFYEK